MISFAAHAHKTTQMLFDFARRDIFLKKVLDDFGTFGGEVKISFKLQNGSYKPETVLINHADMLDDIDLATGTAIELSYWQSKADMIHYFIHELIHFYQDMHGLFFTPLLTLNEPFVVLNELHYTQLYLMCEAMAETESFAIQQSLKGISADKAGFFLQWYQSKDKIYYKKRAQKIYKKNVQMYENRLNITDHDLHFFYPTWDYIFALLGESPEFSYLKSAFDHTVEHHNAFMFKHGSPAYLWGQKHAKSRL